MAVCLQMPAANCQDRALRKIGSTFRFRQLLPGLTRQSHTHTHRQTWMNIPATNCQITEVKQVIMFGQTRARLAKRALDLPNVAHLVKRCPFAQMRRLVKCALQ